MDSVNNVYRGWLVKNSKPLIVSAHMDTVFPSETSLHMTREEDRIYGPGIGDNSLGVAALFGLLWMIRERKIELKNDVWFVANVCEEGLGDLRGMKAVVDRFGEGVKAYLVIEGGRSDTSIIAPSALGVIGLLQKLRVDTHGRIMVNRRRCMKRRSLSRRLHRYRFR